MSIAKPGRTSLFIAPKVAKSSVGLNGRSMVNSTIRIMIVDEHSVIRAGVAHFLGELDYEIQLVEVSSGKEALKQIQHSDFDLILLSMTLPFLDVSTVLKDMKISKPDLPILVFSLRRSIRIAVQCIRLGAVGYVDMGKAPDELLDAVCAVLDKARYIPSFMVEWLANETLADQQKELHHFLSPRELEVMRMVASGMRIKQIARNFSLSPKTVSTYRTRLLDKMGMQTNAELVGYALEHGLIDNPVSNQLV